MNPASFYIVGPTATGKSALALALAEAIGGEIINADAFQLYRGLDICTAKPTAVDFARLPHHLFSLIAPSELCDAQRYSELAAPVIADIVARGKTPIVTGGSGLYVKSLTHGLSRLPSDAILREKLSILTLEERVAQLLARDPGAAHSVNLKNNRHVTRALEICLLTNQPQSELRRDWQNRTPDYRGVRLVIDRPRLDARINQRVLNMVSAGLVEEIENLPTLSATAGKAIGIGEIRAHLAGESTLDEAIAAIQLATRQYARRQEKWFRREKGFKPVVMSGAETMEELVHRVITASPARK